MISFGMYFVMTATGLAMRLARTDSPWTANMPESNVDAQSSGSCAGQGLGTAETDMS